MYKLDLGVESPYLGTAYADEAFGKRIVEEEEEQLPWAGLRKGSEVADEEDCRMWYVFFFFSFWIGVAGTVNYYSLNKAIEPVRTRCCNTTFCREHITKVGLLRLTEVIDYLSITQWLRSKESVNTCPSCDAHCVLAPPSLSIAVPSSRSRKSSSSSSTVTASSAISWPSSAGTIDEAEDMWDVKMPSIDVVEMVRDVVGESIRFVGLNGPHGRDAGDGGVRMRMVSVLGLVLVLGVLFR